MSEWINVKDRLPEIVKDSRRSEDVLVFCISHGKMPNTYQKDEGYLSVDALIKWNDAPTSFRGDRFFGTVTHWMPLPLAPE